MSANNTYNFGRIEVQGAWYTLDVTVEGDVPDWEKTAAKAKTKFLEFARNLALPANQVIDFDNAGYTVANKQTPYEAEQTLTWQAFEAAIRNRPRPIHVSDEDDSPSGSHAKKTPPKPESGKKSASPAQPIVEEPVTPPASVRAHVSPAPTPQANPASSAGAASGSGEALPRAVVAAASGPNPAPQPQPTPTPTPAPAQPRPASPFEHKSPRPEHKQRSPVQALHAEPAGNDWENRQWAYYERLANAGDSAEQMLDELINGGETPEEHQEELGHLREAFQREKERIKAKNERQMSIRIPRFLPEFVRRFRPAVAKPSLAQHVRESALYQQHLQRVRQN